MDFIQLYWSQITLILIASGYLIQQILTYWLKLKEIRFNHLHLERVNLIRRLHNDLVIIERQLQFVSLAHDLSPLKMGPTREEWGKIYWEVIEKKKEIQIYFEKDKILFPEKFSKQIFFFLRMIDEKVIATSVNTNMSEDKTQTVALYDSKTFKHYYNNGFKKLISSLEKEFRKSI